jgi:hypothetical protein
LVLISEKIDEVRGSDIIYYAKHYKLYNGSFENLCMNNANVAAQRNNFQLEKTWRLLQLIFATKEEPKQKKSTQVDTHHLVPLLDTSSLEQRDNIAQLEALILDSPSLSKEPSISTSDDITSDTSSDIATPPPPVISTPPTSRSYVDQFIHSEVREQNQDKSKEKQNNNPMRTFQFVSTNVETETFQPDYESIVSDVLDFYSEIVSVLVTGFNAQG